MDDMRYGPATADVSALRARYDADPADVGAWLERWSYRRRIDQRYRLFKLLRDFAWQ
jgi:hypothetical protein